jgi:ankyrin repeat protein
MVLPQTEAEFRVKEAQCVSPNSQASLNAVAELKALPPADQAAFLYNFAHLDLANLARCALAAKISADARSGKDDAPILCVAAQRGSVRVLRVLLDGGANVKLADKQGRTAAHHASYFSHAECLRILLAAGADKATKNERGFTPLHLAAQEGHAECLRILLAAGADKEAKNERGNTPLHLAVQEGHAECLRILLAAGADKEAKNERGFTPLHLASQEGRAEAVEVLLSAGCAVDARNNQQVTPLHSAAQDGHLPVVQQLLARGANPNAADVIGNTPLMNAIMLKHALCVAELVPVSDLSITNAAGGKAFHECAAAGDSECFELLLPLMSDVDVRTVPCVQPNGEPEPIFNQTPLLFACSYGHQAIAKALLRRGASRTAVCSMQRTPLHYACQPGHLFLAALLVGRPGRYKLTPDEVNAADVNGCTPLHYAAIYGHIQCCGVLIAAGARLDVRAVCGSTPLMDAQQFHPANAELHALLAGGGQAQAPGTLCDHCGEPEAETKLKSCIDCLVARYCSTACANAAWRSHKSECRRITAARVERAIPATVRAPLASESRTT